MAKIPAQTAAAKGGVGDSSKHVCSTRGRGIRGIVHTALYGPQLCLVVTFCCHKSKPPDKTKTNEKNFHFVCHRRSSRKKSVKNFISIFYVAFLPFLPPLLFELPLDGWKYEQIMSLENFTSSAAGHMQME